jgi:hypothetical protein
MNRMNTMQVLDPETQFQESLAELHRQYPVQRRDPAPRFVVVFTDDSRSTFIHPPIPPEPIKISRHHTKAKGTEGTCGVCLSNMEENDELTPMTQCVHIYHSTCVDKWLDMNHTCPTCRTEEDPHNSSS